MNQVSNAPAIESDVHPLNVTLNPLQLLWLQECGIDRLWGQPLIATRAALSAGRVTAAPDSQEAPRARPEQSIHADPPAAQARQAAPATTAVDGSFSPAKQVLAQLRQQIKHQRAGGGRSAIGGGQAPAATPAAAGEAAVDDRALSKAALAPGKAPIAPGTGGERWDALVQEISACTRCGLSAQARQPIAGSGSAQARLMIIDEAPGVQDDASGEPLRGPAGVLLDNMLKAIGIDDRHYVFITDVVKCRPMVNRAPQIEEIEACARYLREQMALVDPDCLLVFGRAAQSVLATDAPVAVLRENQALALEVNGRQVPVVVTFHPNHLMANQAMKPQAWEDMKRVRHMLAQATARG